MAHVKWDRIVKSYPISFLILKVIQVPSKETRNDRWGATREIRWPQIRYHATFNHESAENAKLSLDYTRAVGDDKLNQVTRCCEWRSTCEGYGSCCKAIGCSLCANLHGGWGELHFRWRKSREGYLHLPFRTGYVCVGKSCVWGQTAKGGGGSLYESVPHHGSGGRGLEWKEWIYRSLVLSLLLRARVRAISGSWSLRLHIPIYTYTHITIIVTIIVNT